MKEKIEYIGIALDANKIVDDSTILWPVCIVCIRIFVLSFHCNTEKSRTRKNLRVYACLNVSAITSFCNFIHTFFYPKHFHAVSWLY